MDKQTSSVIVGLGVLALLLGICLVISAIFGFWPIGSF